MFQRHPDVGKYFVALFSRYSSLTYSLIRHSVRSPVQADYLFALTWRHVYYELGGLNLREISPAPDQPLTLQSWLIHITALCINRVELPPPELIHYSLQATSPPLWCYIGQALDQLEPIERLMVLMAQTFHWSHIRIAAFLQVEGEAIVPAEVPQRLKQSYDNLEAILPEDIREIYLEQVQNPFNEDHEGEILFEEEEDLKIAAILKQSRTLDIQVETSES